MPDTPTPAQQMVISDLDTLKVLSDSFRKAILEAIHHAGQPLTVKQIAAALEVDASKLYYHMRLLEQHELVFVAETRVISGIIEKQYQISAIQFIVHGSLLTPGDPASYDDVVSLMLEEARREILASQAAGLLPPPAADQPPADLRPYTLRKSIGRFANQAQAEAFVARLLDLLNEFAAGPDDAAQSFPDEAQRYSFLFALYPLAPPDAGSGAESSDVTQLD